MDGKEKEVISVINEGMQKGVLKPDQQTYLALAQSYYYSDQIGPPSTRGRRPRRCPRTAKPI